MPKKKTHKGAAKRFKITANGKIKYRKANRAHILTKKSSKRLRRLRNDGTLSPADTKRIKSMLNT